MLHQWVLQERAETSNLLNCQSQAPRRSEAADLNSSSAKQDGCSEEKQNTTTNLGRKGVR